MAFARISGEIRYYAAALPPGAGDTWYWSGTDPERKAAVDAERDYYELAILTSVADAVRLTIEYSGRHTARKYFRAAGAMEPSWLAMSYATT